MDISFNKNEKLDNVIARSISKNELLGRGALGSIEEEEIGNNNDSFIDKKS